MSKKTQNTGEESASKAKSAKAKAESTQKSAARKNNAAKELNEEPSKKEALKAGAKVKSAAESDVKKLSMSPRAQKGEAASDMASPAVAPARKRAAGAGQEEPKASESEVPRSAVAEAPAAEQPKREENLNLESILDLNANNIWKVDEEQVAMLWEQEREEEGFASSEEKLLNTIRLCFEVVHYNPDDERERKRYENGDWVTFARASARKGLVAIKRKYIQRITDLSYENIKHISAATLLELMDRNFGGGWDSIPLSIKDIIESNFYISTTQLPASRIHMPGGSVERRVAQGFEVLEVAKGTWTEAIFAKKKEPLAKLRCNADTRYDEDGNVIKDNPEDEDADGGDNLDPEDEMGDDTFYSSYAAEAEVKQETEEGLPIED